MRKKKFVIWLSNHTDSNDDEWVSVYAHTEEEAMERVVEDMMYDSMRFTPTCVYTIKEFIKEQGRGLI